MANRFENTISNEIFSSSFAIEKSFFIRLNYLGVLSHSQNTIANNLRECPSLFFGCGAKMRVLIVFGDGGGEI